MEIINVWNLTKEGFIVEVVATKEELQAFMDDLARVFPSKKFVFNRRASYINTRHSNSQPEEYE